MIDSHGVIVDFPSRSLLTGLIANALGYRRTETDRLARLQERIVFAARIDREGERLTDFQTVSLGADDQSWTTRGRPEGRAGGASTYLSPHIRRRDFDADTCVTVALRLVPPHEAPDLDAVATALNEPARPLFLGRKCCPPTGPIFAGFVERSELFAALLAVPLPDDDGKTRPTIRLLLPEFEASKPQDEIRFMTDERNWRSGVHAGSRRVRIRFLPRTDFAIGEGP